MCTLTGVSESTIIPQLDKLMQLQCNYNTDTECLSYYLHESRFNLAILCQSSAVFTNPGLGVPRQSTFLFPPRAYLSSKCGTTFSFCCLFIMLSLSIKQLTGEHLCLDGCYTTMN